MKWINLFRVFFPSWKFFQDLGEIPVLYFRISITDPVPTDWREWTEALPRETRTLGSLFLNSKPNLLLAYQSMLFHLVQEINEFPEHLDFSNSTIFKLVHNLVQNKIKEHATVGDKFLYQFKVDLVSGDPKLKSQEPLLISPIYNSAL